MKYARSPGGTIVECRDDELHKYISKSYTEMTDSTRFVTELAQNMPTIIILIWQVNYYCGC